jgi:hypothetical protein
VKPDISVVETTTSASASSTELEAKIDAIFEKIETLLAERKVDELAPAFKELNDLMVVYKRSGTDKVSSKLRTWEKKLGEWREVRSAIQLQIYVNQGNELLRALVHARNESDVAGARAAWDELEQLVAKMRAEEGEGVKRNADALEMRGSSLLDAVLANLSRFVLKSGRTVEGVLIKTTETEYRVQVRSGEISIPIDAVARIESATR